MIGNISIIDLLDGGRLYDAIVKSCMHCGKDTFIKITEEQYNRWINNREYVQDIFPQLDKEQREQMISGTHPKCWNEMFGSLEEALELISDDDYSEWKDNE
jgi:hypothetical protein